MSRVENADIVLAAVLGCGIYDISVLDGVEYNLQDIIEECKFNRGEITLNGITDEIFRMGQLDLQEAVEKRLEEAKSELGDYEEDSAEYMELKEEMDALRRCNPNEDMQWYCNCLDTSCWFGENEEIYRDYLGDQIRDIERNMGFEF